MMRQPEQAQGVEQGGLATLAGSLGAARAWLFLFLVTALMAALSGRAPWLVTWPDALVLPIAAWINDAMAVFIEATRGVFRATSGALGLALGAVQAALHGLPWTATVALFTLVAWQGGGVRVAAVTLAGLIYILVTGYWEPSLNTLALVLVALPLSVLIGFGLGWLGVRSARAERIIMPLLDLMQTVPAFAYLIPILLLFGFGPVVGLIASVIFAVPPMVRNTMLGFRLIPREVVESADMSGCTPAQRFLWAEVPSAWPQMLVGVNQTTMAALSMVIIAAIIGGFDDIGWAVLSAMRKAQFGQSLLSGLVIVVLAILLDRITAAYAARQLPGASHAGVPARRFAAILALSLAVAWAVAAFVPGLAAWPEAWTWAPAQKINAAVNDFMVLHGATMAEIKNAVLFYILLPAKLGLDEAIVPFTWGVTFTPTLKALFWAVVMAGALGGYAAGWWRAATGLIALAGFLYLGATGLPWASVVAFVALAGWLSGGTRVAALGVGTCLFLLVNGVWPQAMLSVYLCFVAVAICIALGGLIGIWAAGSETVSAVIRPVNDLLQTMPQFVLLIPALMLFQVGDFTALLAIIAYAIVPMIRYTENGLRRVPETLIEAGIASGLTRWQLFWLVKVPQAIPQILLGINQTVLYGLGMLVIAALVGTTGLGQAIYLALGEANAGAGIVAGLGMALIAMTADRILQSLIRRH